jgi:hypothetical protein
LAVLLTVLVTACATGPEGPGDGGPPSGPGRGGRGTAGGPPREDETWKQYDVNGDGKVTRTEFLAARRLCFVRYDANEDAVLAPAEIRRRLPGRLAEGLGAVVARMDHDQDGDVSREEFDRNSDRLFQFLDTNGDGVIAGMEPSAFGTVLHADLCQVSGEPRSNDVTKPPGAPRKPGTRSGP